jgi:hypothetical protein
MRGILFVFAALAAGCASQGHFVDQSMFAEQPFVEGHGSSREAAERSALAAIPAGFDVDVSWNGKAGGCDSLAEDPAWDEAAKSFTHCASGHYRVQVPLLPHEGRQRAMILAARSEMRRSRETYVGHGETAAEARASLLAQLPEKSVVFSYSFGCSKGGSVDPVTHKGFCDKRIPGNEHEAQAIVLKPNVEEAIQ